MVSKLVETHIPCPVCSSSDAYCIYEDGHGFCFSCQTYIKGDHLSESDNYTYEYFPHRGISAESFRLFNVRTKCDGSGKPISAGFEYPGGAATKVRLLSSREFYWTGAHKPGLFGIDKFAAGSHKYVTITEGEYDALSLYQVLRSPVVSVQSASSAKRDCVADHAYLSSFERIYLAFDADAAGREAVRSVARLFDFNKIYLVKFSNRKDANEYLQAGEADELRNIWVNSRKYLPENIKSTFQEFDTAIEASHREGVPYPFPTLTEMTYGIRTGESVLVTAPEGVGKTEFMRAIEHQLLEKTDDNIGAFFIEEATDRHLKSLAGVAMRRPAHLPDCGVSNSEVSATLRKVIRRDERLYVYSHFGSDDPDVLLDAIRFLVTACSCRYILLDHITMAVTGLAGESDERRALDYLSTRLEMMVVELDFALIFVSHVNDFGQTRGSRNMGKIANIRIDLARDTMATDITAKNTTTLSIPKNRFGMKTGSAGSLLFDPYLYNYSEVTANDVG
jgi:twinkle protein